LKSAAAQVLILLFFSVVVSFGVNLVSPNKIDLIGNYRNLSSGDGPIVPPSAEPGDPPFIDVNTAQMEHATGGVLWVDARSPEEFECGTIPESINVPFEYLPEGDLDPFFRFGPGGPEGSSNYHFLFGGGVRLVSPYGSEPPGPWIFTISYIFRWSQGVGEVRNGA
jgi:hypothetical protein